MIESFPSLGFSQEKDVFHPRNDLVNDDFSLLTVQEDEGYDQVRVLSDVMAGLHVKLETETI